jgi:large-conductance mechanosensitive channel
MLKAFGKIFIRGNFVDMAVGGGAFTTVVTALSKDLLAPPAGHRNDANSAGNAVSTHRGWHIMAVRAFKSVSNQASYGTTA